MAIGAFEEKMSNWLDAVDAFLEESRDVEAWKNDSFDKVEYYQTLRGTIEEANRYQRAFDDVCIHLENDPRVQEFLSKQKGGCEK